MNQFNGGNYTFGVVMEAKQSTATIYNLSLYAIIVLQGATKNCGVLVSIIVNSSMTLNNTTVSGNYNFSNGYTVGIIGIIA